MSSPQMRVVAAFMRLALKGKAAPDLVAAPKEPPRPPAKLVQRHDVNSRRIDGFECHTVSPRGHRAERSVVYLHGGAYIRHLSPRHWQLISQLVDAGVRVEVAHYGLAPKYTYRDAYPFVAAVYRDLLLARGIIVSHETVRAWCDRFGPQYAAGLRRRRPQAGDKWHLDEAYLKVNSEWQYLWRAVDQDGNVLDILVQSRRNAKAARRFMARLMKKQRRVPRVMVTDKLKSYGTAHGKLMPSVEHRSHKGLNNRAGNSHQPTRQRERAMKGFHSPGRAQKFLSVFSQISPHFRPRRHLMTATEYRTGDAPPLRNLERDHRHHRHVHRGLSQRRKPDPPHPDTNPQAASRPTS